MKTELIEKIRASAEKLGITDEISLDYPENPEFGDYTSNIALVGSKKVGKNPKELAGEILSIFDEIKPEFIKSAEIAGPGFINFKIKDREIAANVTKIADDKNFGKNESLADQKLLVEHTQPNPFKEFHIGHLMNNAIGESLSRIFEYSGATVKKATYHGDVGLHVAKTLWGMKKTIQQSGKKEIDVSFMGASYAEGNTAYEENQDAKKEILEINKKIYESTDDEINRLYKEGKKISLEYFEAMYKRLGSSFDYHFFESEAGKVGVPIVLDFLKKDVFEKSEGAVVFKGEEFGLHTRVFLNKEGLPTYEAKELGLLKIKSDLYKYDLALTVTANEQNDFFKVVEKVASIIFKKGEDRFSHVSHGMLRFSSGKMSSRTGNVITANKLIDDIRILVEDKMKEVTGDLDTKMKDEIADQIAIGAIKYTILRQSIGGDVIFDSAKSISFEGDSGPYLQYSAIRAVSVIKKANDMGMNFAEKNLLPDQVGLLERLILRFPDIVLRAGKDYSPQHIAGYLLALSGAFNSYYAIQKIVDENDPLSSYRINVVRSFVSVMKNGLYMLGIQIPMKM